MNFHRLVIIGILTLSCASLIPNSISKNTFLARSFSSNMAQEIILQKAAWDGIQKPESWHGTLQVSLQYNQMFNAFGNPEEGLGSRPFWTGTNTMTVGNNANLADPGYDGGPYNVDAWQFGLGTVSTPGKITLTPTFHQQGAILFLYVGAHQEETGGFFKFLGPISSTVIDPVLTEQAPTTNPYPAGMMQIPGINATATTGPFNPTMTQAFTGLFILNNDVVFEGLQFGKINGKQSSGAQFSDVNVVCGYNFIAKPQHHIGIGIRISAPTGNTPQAIYMLEPSSGAGGSWKAGLECIAHCSLYENQTTTVKLWFDAYAMHVFKGRQIRSFDTTANGPGSKYLLVGDFGPNGNDSQYIFQQLINVSSLVIDSKIDITLDSALLFDIEHLDWNISLGYNFWGKSREHISLEQSFQTQRYGFIGHQPSVQLNNLATGVVANLVDPSAKMNQLMPRTSGSGVTPGNGLTAAPGNMIAGSQALDIAGAESEGAWSSKIFCRVAYQWKETNLIPTLGLYTSTEFSQSGTSALSQWSVSLQGGISF
jgi:hypothetical protein